MLEELSHGAALLGTIKSDLDGMYARLRKTRASLAAAFPQHAVAPARCAASDEEQEEGGERARRAAGQRQQPPQQQQQEPAAASQGGEAQVGEAQHAARGDAQPTVAEEQHPGRQR